MKAFVNSGRTVSILQQKKLRGKSATLHKQTFWVIFFLFLLLLNKRNSAKQMLLYQFFLFLSIITESQNQAKFEKTTTIKHYYIPLAFDRIIVHFG